MWYKIKQGKHRASPLSLGFHKGKLKESYEVIFDESCRYDVGQEDQLDWNKLVGWSHGILPKIRFKFKSISLDGIDWDIKFIPAHQWYSTRIGWRYNPIEDNIELCNYHYFQGHRAIRSIRTVFIGEKVILTHDMTDSSFNGSTLKVSSKRGYNLGLYFGGNKEQPNKEDMKVWIKKLENY